MRNMYEVPARLSYTARAGSFGFGRDMVSSEAAGHQRHIEFRCLLAISVKSETCAYLEACRTESGLISLPHLFVVVLLIRQTPLAGLNQPGFFKRGEARHRLRAHFSLFRLLVMLNIFFLLHHPVCRENQAGVSYRQPASSRQSF